MLSRLLHAMYNKDGRIKLNKGIQDFKIRQNRKAIVQLVSPSRSTGTDTGGHEKACTGTARQARPLSGK